MCALVFVSFSFISLLFAIYQTQFLFQFIDIRLGPNIFVYINIDIGTQRRSLRNQAHETKEHKAGPITNACVVYMFSSQFNFCQHLTLNKHTLALHIGIWLFLVRAHSYSKYRVCVSFKFIVIYVKPFFFFIFSTFHKNTRHSKRVKTTIQLGLVNNSSNSYIYWFSIFIIYLNFYRFYRKN